MRSLLAALLLAGPLACSAPTLEPGDVLATTGGSFALSGSVWVLDETAGAWVSIFTTSTPITNIAINDSGEIFVSLFFGGMLKVGTGTGTPVGGGGGQALEFAGSGALFSRVGDSILEIDVGAGTSSVVVSGLDSAFPTRYDLAIDPATGDLYTTTDGDLIRVDPGTGATAVVVAGLGAFVGLHFAPSGELLATVGAELLQVDTVGGTTSLVSALVAPGDLDTASDGTVYVHADACGGAPGVFQIVSAGPRAARTWRRRRRRTSSSPRSSPALSRTSPSARTRRPRRSSRRTR